MARIAVVFGTTDGQTAKIARFVAEILRREGHELRTLDTRDPLPAEPLEGIDAVVLAGSIRMGRFQRALVEFARTRRDSLRRVPTVFLAVSLSASHGTPGARREVRKQLDRFAAETGFVANAVLPVAGSLRYTQYGFFTRLLILLISKIAGGDTDTSRDYEYTDWLALTAFVRMFSTRLRGTPALRAAS
jgi:menaquinone-dependent protoporphyrinogen oxidase